MNFTRREFLLSSAALTIGGKLFALPLGWKHSKKPNIVFGVLSDTHLRVKNGKGAGPNRRYPHKFFKNALEYFKSRNVDGIVHCGDWAHRGQVEEMRFHANVWKSVFGSLGGPEKLFVTGNHDEMGAKYGDFAKRKYPDPEVRNKHILAIDIEEKWKKIWGEPYSKVWHKEVKGYHFFGSNWGAGKEDLAQLIDKTGKTVDLNNPTHPFFFITHCRPWKTLRRKASLARNAVSFFGHNHWSISNWNIISLYYNRLPCFQCGSCEPRVCRALVGDSWISRLKLEGREKLLGGRQGYLVSVYNDMMVVERHEFTDGESSLGAHWAMPFEENKIANVPRKHPLSRDELKKVIGKPQFKPGAEIKAKVVFSIKNPEKRMFQVDIPLADGNPDSRVYAYEIVIVDNLRKNKIFKAVYSAGCHIGVGREPNGGVTSFEVPFSEVAKFKTLKIYVRPISSLGTSGNPIVSRPINV